MPTNGPTDRPARRLSWRAERMIQMTTDLAYAAGLGLAVSASGVAAQSDAGTRHSSEQHDMTTANKSEPGQHELGEQLEQMKQDFASRAPAEMIKLFEQGVLDVEALGVLDSAKKVGDKAPGFELSTATGETVSLASVLASGPAVVTFYRGSWCPYCNIQLRSYQQHLGEIQSLGAQLVAISPETPDVTADSDEAKGYEFIVLSDAGNEAADDFGIRYRLPDELIEAFRGRLDIERRNGDDSWTLPLAATYVIDTDGTITYAFVSADYRTRAEPAEILAALKSIADAR